MATSGDVIAAPFLTALVGEPESATIAIPAELYERPVGVPSSAAVDVALFATTASLVFDDEAERLAWERCWSSPAIQYMIADAFWFIVARYLRGVDEDDALIDTIHTRMADHFVAVFLAIDGALHDLVGDNIADAIAQTVFYMIDAAYPALRHRLTTTFATNVAAFFSDCIDGPIRAPIDVRHWRLLPRPAPLHHHHHRFVHDSIDALDRDDLPLSEKIDVVGERRRANDASIVPLQTTKTRVMLSTSPLVTKFLRGAPSPSPILRMKVTRGAIDRQLLPEAMFKRRIDEHRAHRLNLTRREALAAARRLLSGEIASDRRRRRRRRSDDCPHRRSHRRAEFVAAVVKTVEDDPASRRFRRRTVSDETRAEYRLGPAPGRE